MNIDNIETPGFTCPGCGHHQLYFNQHGTIANVVRSWEVDGMGTSFQQETDWESSDLDNNLEWYCPYCGRRFESMEEAVGIKQ